MKKLTYTISNGSGATLTYQVKAGSRIHASLEALRMGPLPAPSPIRRSDHILHFRKAGMVIKTEMRPQSDGGGQYGVYLLQSDVSSEVDAYDAS